jgi:hypothetical protein
MQGEITTSSGLCISHQGCQMVYFQTQIPTLGKILEGLVMEDVGIFYDHLVCFTASW